MPQLKPYHNWPDIQCTKEGKFICDTSHYVLGDGYSTYIYKFTKWGCIRTNRTVWTEVLSPFYSKFCILGKLQGNSMAGILD